ncbi:unnamed protein product, partial [Laminaria digitata]
DNESDRRPLACLASGYLRPLALTAIYLVASAGALFVAAVCCLIYILGAVLLWLRGLYGVIEWCKWEWKNSPAGKNLPADGGKGAVMPGAWGVDGDAWENAKSVAINMSCTSRKRAFAGDAGHFDVELLLHMTTGWDLGHLSSLVRCQEEKEKEKEDKLLRDSENMRSNVRHLRSAEME